MKRVRFPTRGKFVLSSAIFLLVIGMAVLPSPAIALPAAITLLAESPSSNGQSRSTGGLQYVPRPVIAKRMIPFGPKRKRQMAGYSKRHYGEFEWRLHRPRVIVQHYSVTPDIKSLFNVFASNGPDPEFGESPNVCAHFGVSRSGRIFQFAGLDKRCRHTVGLNHASIGIEHVGYSDGQVLSNRRQMRSSLNLTRWLRCRYRIATKNVIGHNESLRSPYHREKVKGMKAATHGDFRPAAMNRYRRQLRRAGQC